MEKVIKEFEQFNNDEYFLITFDESGDEIHFILMGMEHYDYVNNAVNEFSYRNFKNVDKFIAYCYDNEIKVLRNNNFFLQTYCDEEWPYSRYNIKRIIYVPELGN